MLKQKMCDLLKVGMKTGILKGLKLRYKQCHLACNLNVVIKEKGWKVEILGCGCSSPSHDDGMLFLSGMRLGPPGGLDKKVDKSVQTYCLEGQRALYVSMTYLERDWRVDKALVSSF